MISFREFASHLKASAARTGPALEYLVRDTTAIAVEKAKGFIGHLQPEWSPLAESTKTQKASLGFTPPDYQPLLRSGEMRASIEGFAVGLTGMVGSNDEVAVFQELGTSTMPPRPFLSLAVMSIIPELTIGAEEICANLLVPAGGRR